MKPAKDKRYITFGRLTNLLLGNFKAFRRTQRIPIRPITLIYGKNNSGKSSIIQSLLYAESVRRTGNLNPDSIEKDGEVVIDGGYDRLVHGRSDKRKIEFGWEWENPEAITGLKKGSMHHKIEDMDYGVVFNYTLNDQTFMEIKHPDDVWRQGVGLNLEHSAVRGAMDEIRKWIVMMLKQKSENGDGSVLSIYSSELYRLWESTGSMDYILDRITDYSATMGILLKSFGIPPQFIFAPIDEQQFRSNLIYNPDRPGFSMIRASISHKWIEGYFGDCGDAFIGPNNPYDGNPIRSELETRCGYFFWKWFEDVMEHFTAPLTQLIGQTHYLASSRRRPDTILFSEPKRARDETELDETEGGNQAPPRMAQKQTREHHGWIWQKATFDNANRWLRKHKDLVGDVQIGYEEISINGKNTAKLTALQNSKRRVTLDLKEVGFGLSQFIPVLLAAFAEQHTVTGGSAGTLLVEEPEAHIHPALQSEIGDLFIGAIERKSNPLSYVICETHSEHILLRIMRRIREGKLSPSMVSVLYVENLGKESIVRSMPINERGEMIRDWPGGFFEEGLREVLT